MSDGRALDATATYAEAWRMLDSIADDLQPGRAMEASIGKDEDGELLVYGPGILQKRSEACVSTGLGVVLTPREAGGGKEP